MPASLVLCVATHIRSWRDWVACPSDTFMCGARLRIQADQVKRIGCVWRSVCL